MTKPTKFWRVKWLAPNGVLVITIDKIRARDKLRAIDKARKIVRQRGREPNRLTPVAEWYEFKEPVAVETTPQKFWWMED